ncbi:MAG: ATP-binding cassette domain-containing protein [Anaerolineae bacterium]|nr:ATP-binding cassette domain-containing protein [Anaerolineae bacterium]
MIAVSVQDLSWKYSGRNNFAIEHVSLDIKENAFVSIVGPNESGKTTLVSCIKGLIPSSFHGVWRGTVEVFGENVRTKSAQELAREIGFVFSDPESQFTAMTVEEELVFGMENIGLPLEEIEERLHWVSETAMIDDLLDKSPYEISGGQKQRVAIASVLAMKPRIFILDEPTSMLDPLGKDFIFQILTDLKREENLTLIVVEHNIEQVAPLSDMMVLVYNGSILKAAPPAEFFEDIAFLEAHAIQPPQATAFASRLKQRGLLEESLPIHFEDTVAAVESVLAGTSD